MTPIPVDRVSLVMSTSMRYDSATFLAYDYSPLEFFGFCAFARWTFAIDDSNEGANLSLRQMDLRLLMSMTG